MLLLFIGPTTRKASWGKQESSAYAFSFGLRRPKVGYGRLKVGGQVHQAKIGRKFLPEKADLPGQLFPIDNLFSFCQYVLAMIKEEKKEFQQLVGASLINFWDQILEPALSTKADKADLEKLATKEDLSEVRKDLQGLSNQVDSIDRRLEAETTYRDHLEKRVVRVEDKLSLPHHP